MLEQRVENLEKQMEKVETRLGSIEALLVEIRADLRETKIELRHLPKMTDYVALTKEMGDVKMRLSGIEGRMTNLPSTWTLLSFTIGSVLASAGLAFTIARLLVR